MIAAFIITIQGDEQQFTSATRLISSIERTGSEIAPVLFRATTPETIKPHLREKFKYFNANRYKWSWPETKSEEGYCLKSGLYKPMYNAKNQRRIEACLISHMRVWEECVQLSKPIIVLEADALFTKKFHSLNTKADIVGLNHPANATRRAREYHDQVSSREGINPVPTVNMRGELSTPQGIAGNSAYYITPMGAKKMLDLVTEYGGWPNDALMCKELLNNTLKTVYPYYTTVQGTQSTTTG